MLTFNETTLNTVIATARKSAAGTAWESRIERAAIELATNPYIEIAGDHLLIGSPSGNSYDVNGSCQCTAYTGINEQGERIHAGNKPCWHRTAKRIVLRYNEAEARKQAAQRALESINELF